MKLKPGRLYRVRTETLNMWPQPLENEPLTSRWKAKRPLEEGDVLIFIKTISGSVDMTCPDGTTTRHHMFMTKWGVFGRNANAKVEKLLTDITPL